MATPAVTSADDAGWRFAQCFGDKGEVEDITEADIISTVEFDHTGDYLATGDKGGRVVLFERNETKKGCEYKFYTEFQSHEPEFDYLKSLEIEEKINKIRWCKRQNAAHFLLSTNDKTIKLWKVFEKSLKVVAENNGSAAATGAPPPSPPPLSHTQSIPGLPSSPFSGPSGSSSSLNSTDPTTGQPIPYLRLPRMTYHDTIVAAVPRKVYANAHAYHINSISINSDGETYMSADDLRINLWNLNISDQSFNILDIKPVNMEELTEVITAAEFHPVSCNLFCYSSSKGTVKLADMREQALCDKHAKLFEEEEDPSNKSFFSEIISSVSDVKFSRDGRYILSRDYLTLKIWDIKMESKPLQTINVHDHLRSKLCDLYENDCIFDKFECTFSGDGNNVLSGSYNNYFHIYDQKAEQDIVLQADKSAFKAKKIGANKGGKGATGTGATGGANGGKKGAAGGANGKPIIDTENIDFNKKILHASWHPRENTIAIAATNNLFLYSQAGSSGGSSSSIPTVAGGGGP
ncbi:protein phosphatase 2A regulatory subunit CDC55 [Sporobolomyces salmoneus]|uniref:protein phosphatase 2A regulatory subunit CDC55 n=1 Tax=Sporobolomyces salmoneus TaxID=183962 RepID=UPI00316B3875